MFEHDDEDPPAQVGSSDFQKWLSRHWEFWKMSWMVQLMWCIIYVCVFLVLKALDIM